MAARSTKVYVVDDENVIAATLATILKQSGFDAIAFTDPLEALTSAKESAPDLLISDVIMPQMTGVDLAIHIQKVAPACKVLLFSGRAATADLLQKAKQDGYDFVLLAKPVHPADLLSVLHTLK